MLKLCSFRKGKRVVVVRTKGRSCGKETGSDLDSGCHGSRFFGALWLAQGEGKSTEANNKLRSFTNQTQVSVTVTSGSQSAISQQAGESCTTRRGGLGRDAVDNNGEIGKQSKHKNLRNKNLKPQEDGKHGLTASFCGLRPQKPTKRATLQKKCDLPISVGKNLHHLL